MKTILTKLLLLAGFSVPVVTMSQTVQGKVSTNQKPAESASVGLLRAKDSSVAKLAVTDKNGDYLFEKVNAGKYLLTVQLVGHEKQYSPVFDLAAGANYTAPVFALKPLSKDLAGVTVSSRKPMIEQKIDRTIVNVENSVTSAGSNALEVLEKSPGVSVDKDGNISLKGKAGVMVFIDGRPTYLSGQDLTNMLRNMQSNQVELLEIMTNPPAKYDAAGNAGVINIKTKKTKVFGFNGSASVGYTQAVYNRFNESLNLNYRKNKVNLFGNLSHNYRNNFQVLEINRKFFDNTTKDVLSLFTQSTRMRNQGNSYNGKMGMDYFAGKNTTFGIVVNGFINPGEFRSSSVIDIANPSNVLQRQTVSGNMSEQEWKHFGTNLNFRHVLDTTGKEITADLDYLRYDATNTQELINSYFNNVGVPIFRPDTLLGNLPQQIKIYSAKVDYVQPMKKGAKLEAGLKTSFVQTDANAIYDTVLNGQLRRDVGRSNHFVYEEQIHAAYVNYSKQISPKWSGQLGLRLEQTVAKGQQLTTGETFTRDYAQLFPTVYVQYTANKKNSFVLNYGRRIRRPDYESLNPFVEFLDRYTYEKGNPYLRPQFSHNVELSHTFMGFLTTTLNYTNTTDIIQQVLEQHSDKNETFVKQANIASQRQYGISVNAFNQYTKWWSGNIYVNVYNNEFKGIINNDYVTIGNTTAMVNVSQQFKFNKTWSGELSGFYRSEGIEGVFRIGGFGMVNAGVSKQVMKGKGSVRLNVRDIFWSQRINGKSRFGTIDANFHQYNDSRFVNLSFTYRFSKGKVGNTQPKRGGASDEQSRVSIGNN